MGPPTTPGLQGPIVVQQPRTTKLKVGQWWNENGSLIPYEPTNNHGLDVTIPHPKHGCHVSMGGHGVHITTTHKQLLNLSVVC